MAATMPFMDSQLHALYHNVELEKNIEFVALVNILPKILIYGPKPKNYGPKAKIFFRPYPPC